MIAAHNAAKAVVTSLGWATRIMNAELQRQIERIAPQLDGDVATPIEAKMTRVKWNAWRGIPFLVQHTDEWHLAFMMSTFSVSRGIGAALVYPSFCLKDSVCLWDKLKKCVVRKICCVFTGVCVVFDGMQIDIGR